MLPWLSKSHLLSLLPVLVLAAGCDTSPEFSPNRIEATEMQLVPEHVQQVEATMAELFGTPDEPLVPEGIDLDPVLLRMAAGQAGYEKHEDGEEYLQRGMFRQYCASCHGVTGDGTGPAAGMMLPYPRDFTAGVFKWKSTYLEAKPTDDDLRQVLIRGIPGTAMPSFRLLNENNDGDEQQYDALVEYTKYLAIRGEFERQLIAAVGNTLDSDSVKGTTDEPFDPAEDPADQQLVDELLATLAQQWRDAENQVLVPDPATTPAADRSAEELAASVEAGRKLYHSLSTKCLDCHGADGRGGALSVEMDVWNKRLADFKKKTAVLAADIEYRQSQRQRNEELLAADRHWLELRRAAPNSQLGPQIADANDLTSGVYRGGGEPVDLFRRIHQGIAGTPMPGQGSPRPGVEGSLSEAEVWQVVDYIRSLAKTNE